MASPSQSNRPKTRYTRKWIISITVLIAILLVTSLLVYTTTLLNETSEPEKTDKLFQQNLKEFSNTIAVDDDKFFILDDMGNLTCLDAQKGNLLWQTDVGEWRSGGILINNGTIYAGTGGSAVQAVDEATGKLLKRYDGLLSTAWKGPPNAYSVGDGRIFIKQDGCNAYDLATGQMLWKTNPASMLNPEDSPHIGNAWSFEGKLSLAIGSFSDNNEWVNGIYRINPDKGTPLWHIQGYIYETPLIYQDNVILSNYGIQQSVDLCDSIVAVTVSSGVKVWSYDVESPIFKPSIVGDKLLFAAWDGNFYALNLSNGTLAWKTPLIDTIPSEASVSTATVDTENQEVYWACVMDNPKGVIGNFPYEGTVYRMDLVTGLNLTKTQFQGNATNPLVSEYNSQGNPFVGLALLKNTAYLTVQNDLWFFNKTDLAAIKTEHFDYSYDHNMLQPIEAYGHVYVSGGRYAIAYKDIE
jgi:outer membrane protein assembly factor BamB